MIDSSQIRGNQYARYRSTMILDAIERRQVIARQQGWQRFSNSAPKSVRRRTRGLTRVHFPTISTPRIFFLTLKWPEIDWSKFRPPKFNFFGLKWPHFNFAKINWSKFYLTKINWPKFRLKIHWPKIYLPKIRWLKFHLPKINWPKLHLPKVRWPSISFPSIQLPYFLVWWIKHRLQRVHFPNFKIPHIRLPRLNWPFKKIFKLRFPRIHFPILHFPNWKMLKFHMPNWKMLKFHLPHIKLPGIPQWAIKIAPYFMIWKLVTFPWKYVKERVHFGLHPCDCEQIAYERLKREMMEAHGLLKLEPIDNSVYNRDTLSCQLQKSLLQPQQPWVGEGRDSVGKSTLGIPIRVSKKRMPSKIVMPTNETKEDQQQPPQQIPQRSISVQEGDVDELEIGAQRDVSVTRSASADRLTSYRLLPKDGPTEPDPSAERDLDNASPMTTNICNRHSCHFCIYVHAGGNSVDENLFPFRRQERLVEAKKTVLDEVDRQEFEAEPGVQDAMRDRRLIHIERSTECEIRLGEINGRLTVKKGIPRRRLTIAGPTFAHICVALQMLEKAFPHQMQYALYPYRLPVSVSSNYQTDERMNIPSTMLPGPTPRMPGVMSLVNNTNETGGWKKYLPSKNPQNKI